ncbi:hypothetical protein MRX96_035416 [Rhipicephalus microplus]
MRSSLLPDNNLIRNKVATFTIPDSTVPPSRTLAQIFVGSDVPVPFNDVSLIEADYRNKAAEFEYVSRAFDAKVVAIDDAIRRELGLKTWKMCMPHVSSAAAHRVM